MLKIDEINKLIVRQYEHADIITGTLNRKYISIFNRLKSIYPFNEKKVIESVNKAYGEIAEIAPYYFLMLAKKTYKDLTDEDLITEMWLLHILEEYNPITKYVYVHEIDRKRARLIEALISADDKPKEVETAKRLWVRQSNQYADIVVDNAVTKAFTDNDVLEVIWMTEDDTRVCKVCDERDGKIYQLNKIPSKPHYGCRCWVMPYVSERN